MKTPAVRRRTPEELEEEILQTVARRPGITQRELVEWLIVSDEVVGYHLRKLVCEARIVGWRRGRTRVYYPLNKKS